MPADYTPNSKRDAQISANTAKTGLGNEERLMQTDGKLHTYPPPCDYAQKGTVDASVKASGGTLYGFYIIADGVTAGDKVEIRDSTEAGAGSIIFSIVFASEDEVHFFSLDRGIAFSAGLYHDTTLTGGVLQATYAYE